MARLKKSEAFTAEREREIQQASESSFLIPFGFSHFPSAHFYWQISLSLLVGCWIGQWSCANHEGSFSPRDWPGSRISTSFLITGHDFHYRYTVSYWVYYVHKQGTIVDRIDYNIQNVAATVEEGFKQLQKVLPSFLSKSCLVWADLFFTHI